MRFVPPGPDDPYYEVGVYETGRVSTRPEALHDWFNALAWLAFPITKARINSLHARELPRESKGRRGPLRDLLTIFDEGGAIVVCRDEELLALAIHCTQHAPALHDERRESSNRRERQQRDAFFAAV